MKNVYLIQFGAEFGDEKSKCVFFPYSIGCLAAFAWSKPEICEKYELKELIFIRENNLTERLEEPFLVCFSSYVWNYDYNIDVAKQIKSKYPECKILFGGHQITYEERSLENMPFADFLSCYEGELSFYSLLKELDGGSLENVPSLVYRHNGEIRKNPVASPGAEELVSPYLSGLFDSLLKKDIEYIATIETVRGCPFACAYCDSSLCDRKVKYIPSQRTKAEIDWIADKKIKVCFCIDSNFGISERDVEIAQYLADKKKSAGFPQKIDVALSKEKNLPAVMTAEVLHNANMFNIVTLSVQSTNPDSLRAVGRKNINFSEFRDSIEVYNERGIKPFTELILGLPYETYDSFCDGFQKLIDAGQKYYIEVYRCYILPNAALAKKELLKKYGIQTVTTCPILHHVSPENTLKVSKSAQIVVATDSMPREDWVKSNLFAIIMQAFYFMGLLGYTADYIHSSTGITHRRFFEGLMNYLLNKDCLSGDILRKFKQIFSCFAYGEGTLNYYDKDFGDITWFTEEGLFLAIIKIFDEFYMDIHEYIAVLIPASISEELLKYQKLMVFTPFNNKTSATFSYDFYSFFEEKNSQLKRKELTLTVKQNIQYTSLADYSREVVWFKRKFGGTLCNSENSEITVESGVAE